MRQGRFSLVVLTLAFSSLLGCGLQSESPSAKQASRLMDELRTQTALKARLQQEEDRTRAELAKLSEEAARQQMDLAMLLRDNEYLADEVSELKKERDAQTTAMLQLRQGIKNLLEQAEASLSIKPDRAAAAKVQIDF
jgi:uncharacterized protein YjiS (DUF1127 family)